MDIVVCVKQTFDTEAKIFLAEGQLRSDDSAPIMNPYDEYAVEAALRLVEESGGKVTVVTVGPEEAQGVLRTALAMGADEAVWVAQEASFGSERWISEALAAVIRRAGPFDLILAGNQAVDDGSGQVAIRTAELLGIAHVGAAVGLTLTGTRLRVERDADGDVEVLEGELPLLVTAQQGLNEPRYPSLIGIRKAAKKPIERVTLADLGVSAQGSQVDIAEFALAPSKSAGVILQGDTPQRVQELVAALRETHKLF